MTQQYHLHRIMWQQRHLLWQFTKRDLLTRYQGSMLGVGWIFVTPMLTLLLFTFVFHGIFGMKWPGAHEQNAFSFALFLFVGLSVYQFFTDVVNRATTLILGQPNLVTKVVFPLWILPVALTFSSLVTLLVSLTLLLLIAGFYVGADSSWLWIPVILLPLFLGVQGGAWLFSAVGVYLRDTAQLLSMLTTAMMFLSPIFYPMSAIPEKWHIWFMLNPLTLVIEPLRSVIMLHQTPNIELLAALYLMGVSVAALGFYVFTKLKRGFADVL